MKKVAPLRYGVVFKKAFCDPEIFNAFVHDLLDIDFLATRPGDMRLFKGNDHKARPQLPRKDLTK